MKFTSLLALALLSTVASTLAAPIDKRAADPATQKANAVDATNLNTQFAKLKATDPCNAGESACVQGAFAQCAGGKWSLSPCSAGTSCFALPLVNKRGTSLACDTAADKDLRIAAANGGSAPSPAPATPSKAEATPSKAEATPTTAPPAPAPAATTPASSSSSGDIAAIRKQNAIDAQNQQNQFNSLTPNSSCTNGQNACVKGQFAQCNGGKFSLTPCASGTQCFSLPLVNKAGTSVTCDTQADRDARFKAAMNGSS